MFKSIRWTLQVWHAVVLAVVLTAFGTMTYYGIRHARYQAVDADLRQWAQALAAGFRMHPPRGRPPGERGMPGPGPATAFPGWGDDDDSRPDPRPPQPGGRPENAPPFMPDREPPERGDRFMPPRRSMSQPEDWPDPMEFAKLSPPKIEIPAALAQQFGDPDAGLAYYVFWGVDTEVLQASQPSLDVPYPGTRPEITHRPTAPELPQIRPRGDFREAYVNGPFWTRVLVGRSVRREEAEMRHLAILLALTGAGVLIVGLAGGWIVSQRAVRPIRTITAVAAEISATNLSRRIDTADTKSELGQLADVLNDTFARLDAAFQQQIRFTADASHELRTPLAVIHTNAQLALSRERSPEEYRTLFETCLRASSRMKGLVDSLLLLAGADAGRMTLARSSVDLRQTAAEALEMVAPLAAKRGLKLESDLRSVEVLGDVSRITQVATNLLTNAIRYNRDGGRVSVTVAPSGDFAVLMVADTGVGIPPESRAHIFERFYRVDKARSREDGGSGLGLAICRSIVEAHGGRISFESELGLGTTFTVRLPKAPR